MAVASKFIRIMLISHMKLHIIATETSRRDVHIFCVHIFCVLYARIKYVLPKILTNLLQLQGFIFQTASISLTYIAQQRMGTQNGNKGGHLILFSSIAGIHHSIMPMLIMIDYIAVYVCTFRLHRRFSILMDFQATKTNVCHVIQPLIYI